MIKKYRYHMIVYIMIYMVVSGFTRPFERVLQTPTAYVPPTVTSYPTGFVPVPFPVTGTPNFDCLVGPPSGYGVLTPNAMWNLACGDCLPTQTMWPTMILPSAVVATWDGTGTVSPTVSATPTVTQFSGCNSVYPTATAYATPSGTRSLAWVLNGDADCDALHCVVSWITTAPAAGTSKSIIFQLFPAGVQAQLTYRISYNNTEYSYYSGNDADLSLKVCESSAAGAPDSPNGKTSYASYDWFGYVNCSSSSPSGQFTVKLSSAADWPIYNSVLVIEVEIWASIVCDEISLYEQPCYVNPAYTATPYVTPTVTYSNVVVAYNSGLITYSSGWTESGGVAYYYSAADANGSAVMNFDGVGVVVKYRKAGDKGKFNVYVDDVLQILIDGYASSSFNTTWSSGSIYAPEMHTLRIQTTGTKNASSTGYYVSLYGFDYTGYSVPENPELVVCVNEPGYCSTIDDSNPLSDGFFPPLWSISEVPICMSTPAVSLDAIFGWVQTYLGWLVPDFITDFIESGYLPTQTFCFRQVDFMEVVIWNVSISLAIFATGLLFVYIVGHFVSK